MSIFLRCLAALAALFLTSCDRGISPAAKPGLKSITVQLDWYPEPEHGGLYQAKARGYFEAEGLDVSLVTGGANVSVAQVLASGRAQFGQVASSTVLTAASEGLPLRLVASVFHNAPSVLMVHDSSPVRDFPDLNGKTLMARPNALYLPYLKKKYGISFGIVPQSFQLGEFLADPNFIQEGFYISEFYLIEQKGVKPRALKLWDSGFENAAMIASTQTFLAAEPDTARRFVSAYRKGWADYLAGDATAAHAAMIADNKAINREVTAEFLNFSRSLIIRDKLAGGDASQGESVGKIGLPRLTRQIAQAVDLGAVPAGKVDAETLVPMEFR